jgi:DMSO reductase anchor subunit
MCVDRLEVNLKPACVSACLGNALDFGVIENIPENRIQAKTDIPGFPDPEITHPNIRFQQTRTTQREMTRTDAMPLKYHRDDAEGAFKPVVDEKLGKDKQWNLKKLLTSHESAHVIFTLCTQASVGAFFMLVLGSLLGIDSMASLKQSNAFLLPLFLLVAVSTLGLFKLNMHLGKPHRFYRGFNNLRLSPVSREIAGVSMFYTGLLGYTAFSLWDNPLFNLIANVFVVVGVVGGAVGLYYMYKLYRIPARPFWNHWQTGTAFVGTALSLGSLLMAGTSAVMLPLALPETQALLQCLAGIMLGGLIVEGIGHIAHARAMHGAEHEGAVSYYVQTTEYGKSYLLRNFLLGANAIIVAVIALVGLTATAVWLVGVPLLASMLVMAAFGLPTLKSDPCR